ncbi:MAG: hypothetical protein ACI36X_01285 [Bacteroidaceae bacterium]
MKDNMWLLGTELTSDKGTITDNTTITNNTQLTLSNYGPTVWPAEAWAALEAALAAKSVTPTFKLEDGTPFYYTGAETTNPVSYTRACYIDGYRESIILPFKPTDIKDAEGNSAKGDFIFERFASKGDAAVITFAERDFNNLEANVPYLMRYNGTTSSGTKEFTFVGESLPARPASLGETFIGTYETVPHSAETTRYVLAVDEVNSKDYFGQLASTARIAPYRAYLEIPTDPSGAPARFSIAFGGSDEGGTTGIETAASADRLWAADGAVCLETAVPQQVRVYGLDGSLVRSQWVDGSARIALPQGVYLVNNRKVVVR